MSRSDDARLAEALVRGSPNGILVTDGDGRVRMVNPALMQMVPVVPNPRGRLPLEAVPIVPLAKALEPGRTDEVEFTFSSGNREIHVRVGSLGTDPEVAGARLAVVQDVTKLRAAEDYRRDFVANVSHEMRTPATAIAGYAETLLEDRDCLEPEVVQMVEVIHRNAQRLTSIFEDLLVLAKIDAQKGPLPVESIRLTAFVVEAMDKLSPFAESRQIQMQNLVPGDLMVLCNRKAMGHVVSNLVSNAVKYSFEGGMVTVRGADRSEGILLEVIDVGIGIDPAHHDRVFERFYRVDKGRSRQAGGTGLGLAIVKRMVQKMGGAIDVRSRPGKGSVFRVLLRAGDSA